jgi:crotonobetainyl-CoA:carnitine CoA-transferase CaiB-like acyl-CoA transferase
VVIEAGPGRFAGLADRGLVHCTVRPFSAHGPKSRYAFTDRTIIAAAGSLAYTGDGDREPLFIPVPQAMMEAGAEAAVGVLAALAARDRDGEGQQVDVSMRAAAMMSAFSLPYYAATREALPARAGSRKLVLGVEIPAFHPCRDGFVQVSVAFGGFGPVTTRMARWLVERGTLDAAVADVDWSHFPSSPDEAQDAGRLRALIDGLRNAIAPLSKTDIGTAARAYGFFAAPLMDMADVAAFEQYAQRGLWARQQLADGVEIEVPACFA